MYSLIPPAISSVLWYKATDSASVGADIRATIDAMAGAVASRKPADVKKIEKADIVTIRRNREARWGLDEDDAAHGGQSRLSGRRAVNTEVRAVEPRLRGKYRG